MSEKVEVIFGVRNAPLKAGLEEANNWIRDWRKEVGSQFAGALAAGGIMAGIEGIIEYAKQVRNLSQQYAVSTTVLQQWGAAMEQSGQDMSELAGVFNDLEIARSEAVGGDDEMRKNFQDLGVTIEELRDLGVDQIMMRIANGTMNAASMGKVMGEESVRLRPMMKALAEGSMELGRAMEEGTINALAKTSDELAKLKQELTVGGGEILAFLGKVGRSAVASAEAVGVLATVMGAGLVGTAAAAINGGTEEAKKFWQATIDEARAQLAGFKEEVEATWNPEQPSGGATPAKLGRGQIEQSEKQQQQLDREATLLERLMDLRRQAAMEEANDEEKLAQLLDREHELRLQAADLDESSTDGLEARIKVEEVVLQILQLQNQMADKAKQAREKEAAERKQQAEKFNRDQEAAQQRLRDEEDRVAVLQTQVSLGDDAAQRMSKQLEYANKIKDLEDKITDARASGNLELAATLTRTQQLIRQQAQLASDPTTQAFAKNNGRAPKVSELRKQAEAQAQQKKAQEKFRGRLVDGLIPTARDINGNPIEGIDPVTGEKRKITPPAPAIDPFNKADPRNGRGEQQGPPAPPGFGVNKQPQAQDPVTEKLETINATLKTIEKKLDKPLTHG